MKRKIACIFWGLILSSLLFSQGITNVNPLTDCGLTYGYDAAGNRVFRVLVQCGYASGKTDETDSLNYLQPANPVKDTLISQIQVSLFPNPTTGPFTLSFNQVVDYLEIMIVNSSGQIVRNEKTSGQQIPVDISGLSAGVYYIRLYTTKEQFSKIVVKK